MDKYQEILKRRGEAFYYVRLKKELSECKSVLDVGCGFDSPLGKFVKSFYSLGIDIYKPAVLKSKKKKIHDDYITGDIREIHKYFKNKSFDAVVSLDVIEHFEKREALKIINQMENIAKKKVILLTPNGYFHQEVLGGNIHQIHKSGWEASEFQKMGYTVRGLRGLKYLRNEKVGIKYRPYLLWGFLSFISEIILYPFPSLSFDLFAIKEI